VDDTINMIKNKTKITQNNAVANPGFFRDGGLLTIADRWGYFTNLERHHVSFSSNFDCYY